MNEDVSKIATNLQPNCNEPLTIDQLREMDGQPVFVYVIDHSVFADKDDDFDAWGLCGKSWVTVWDKKRADIVNVDYDFNDLGKTWLAYRYPPVKLDDWEPCIVCRSCANCKNAFIESDMEPCESCIQSTKWDKFNPVGFCTSCGKPLTDEAKTILDKRLRGCMG